MNERTLRVMLLALLLGATAIAAHPQSDPRQCGQPKRDPDGRIARSSAVLAEFQKLHACPSTGKIRGACPGWAIDHVIPLAVCGCDDIHNLQWLPNSIKRCAGTECKDRWERKVYQCPAEMR